MVGREIEIRPSRPAGWLLAGRLGIRQSRYIFPADDILAVFAVSLTQGENRVHALCAVGTVQTATLKKVSRRRGKKETSILDPDSHKLNCSANTFLLSPI